MVCRRISDDQANAMALNPQHVYMWKMLVPFTVEDDEDHGVIARFGKDQCGKDQWCPVEMMYGCDVYVQINGTGKAIQLCEWVA